MAGVLPATAASKVDGSHPVSDSEAVLRALQMAERRMRADRLCRNAIVGITGLLLLAVCLKSLQLAFLLRGAAVYTPLGACSAGLAVYLAWKFRQLERLARIAALIDRRAALHDEVKSAYWFITNPDADRHKSEWMNAQIHRAAERIGQIDLELLFPRPIPGTLYAAPGLIAMVIGLSCIPLPGNGHRFDFRAADAHGAIEESFARRAEALLQEARKRGDTRAAEQIEAVAARLEGGEISQNEALQALDDLSDTWTEGSPDATAIERALEKIAESLGHSESMKEVSEAMREHKLRQAADKMTDLADRLDVMSPERLAAMSQDLRKASDEGPRELANLLEDFKQAAAALRDADMAGTKLSLEKSAEDLRTIEDRLQEFRLHDPFDLKLARLTDDLRKLASEGMQQDAGSKGEDEGSEEQEGNRSGTERRESPRSWPDAAGVPADKSVLRNDTMLPSGMPHAPLESQSAATTLDVQLQKEMVPVPPRPGKQQDDTRAESGPESSRLEYRSAHAEPGNAGKDILDRDSIPRAFRPIIKDYFQAIRPRETQ